ncbi:MAG TPA: 4-alpha-glucanotransferase [Candidatus Dormibacteraeota bacterium]|nr:4-alpha-glucanotransferase [Candidatus Dormibacteraeota bacterium]
MSERARRWGILPQYFGWQGDLVRASPEVEEAILDAMGATKDRPPRLRRPGLTSDPCWPALDRSWGWSIQLYALRSRASWGVGDLADLRRFGRWARKTGASLILLNPLGAQIPALPYQPSPYYASSRRFRNVIYLRVEEVEGAGGVDISAERESGLRLNAQRLIDYDQVFQLKTEALRKIFLAAPQPKGLAGFLRQQGTALRDFATFNAERNPRSSLDFEIWMQFHIDRQLARAARAIGFITDVPVGFAPDGFDAQRWKAYLAPGMRVGAPPDEFFRDGQDWGIPAFNPWLLGRARWKPFVDAIRAAGRHATGVRLDHVMGLFRLFWIPDRMTASQGAYVRYPAPTLLSLLAGESRRARAFVIGEDLGLVEPTVRRHLKRKGSLSYRLVWFESSEPASWPRDAVAAVGTHDLPTVAGVWALSEPEHRLHHLREKLVSMTHLPDDTPPVDVAVDVYRRLALGRPRIVLVSLEDALGVHERPNVPGTTTEMPNWRLALPLPIEAIETSDGPRRIGEAMRAAGR